MGPLVELLTSEMFRRLPCMVAGSSDFRELAWFLRGFECASEKANPGQPPELDGFREWLQVEREGPSNVDWQGIIVWKYGGDREATRSMLGLLDRFLEERAARGLGAIIDEHEGYELKRYRANVSSRKHRG
jgi:hypothetical protein